MTTAVISDAIDQLGRHEGITRVCEPFYACDATWVEIEVPVELPSREKINEVSSTGVFSVETCFLAFPHDWPLSAPRPLLREDFPLNLPHINPHSKGDLVYPCIYEGSLDELLYRFGLDGIIDQLIGWLHSAAAGTLLDLAHGWEPVRRDNCPSIVVFDSDRIIKLAPHDGSITRVNARYYSFDDGIYAVLGETESSAESPIFTQEIRENDTGKWGLGDITVFVVQAPYIDGSPQVMSHYSPESVTDLPTLFSRASALNINDQSLSDTIESHYRSVVIPADQDPRTWQHGVYTVVILLVQRPAPLVGSTDRSIELMPYVVRHQFDPDKLFEPNISVHAAFHSHALTSELLVKTSGLSIDPKSKSIVIIGCGSLGSKIGMHLGRSGFGSMTFLDKETFSPHNAARYGVSGLFSLPAPPKKSLIMKMAFEDLSHVKTRALDCDAVKLFSDHEIFSETVPETSLIVDTTASLQVMAAEVQSESLNSSSSRLARVVMYGQGRSVVLGIEAIERRSRIDDIFTFLFDMCRRDEVLRSSIKGETGDLTRVFVGDNCSSLTMPMTDGTVSRAASLAGLQIEQWLAGKLPETAMLCYGTTSIDNIGMSWNAVTIGETTVLEVPEDGGWSVRVLHHVSEEIRRDSEKWGDLETGGALIGRVCFENRSIIIGGVVTAPSDSIRELARFILGTEELVHALKCANRDSLGHMAFIGTWHSHPKGGPHSGIDRETLQKIAVDAGGLPAVSLVWSPEGLICAVDRW